MTDTRTDSNTPLERAVVFPPCGCGRPSLVVVGPMGWCLHHVAEAIRLLELMREVST